MDVTTVYNVMEGPGTEQQVAETMLTVAITEPEEITPADVSRILHLFESHDKTVRLSASWALGLVVSENPTAVAGSVDTLVSLLASEPESVHEEIYRALGYIASEYPTLVRDALEALDIDHDTHDKRFIAAVRDRELSDSVTTLAGPASEYEGLGAVAPDRESTDTSPEPRPTRGRPPASPPPTPPRIDARRGAFERVKSRGAGSHVDLWLVRYSTREGQQSALLKRIRHRAPAVFDAEFTETLDEWQSIDDHDAIVPVVSHGTIPKPWFVVEYQEGRRLSERLGSLSDREAHWIIDRIVDAVCHAHGSGVLHGGLSPRHIIFSRTYADHLWDYPKLSNWGIPRLLCQFTALPMGVPPSYAAPEQVAPDQFGGVDASTDIYHLGLMSYEILTGRLPFADHPGAVLRKIVTEQPPVASQFADGLPEAVDTVLAKALQKSKVHRYNTVRDFQTELGGALRGASL